MEFGEWLDNAKREAQETGSGHTTDGQTAAPFGYELVKRYESNMSAFSLLQELAMLSGVVVSHRQGAWEIWREVKEDSISGGQ